MFGIVLDTSGYDAGKDAPDCPPTYAAIQKWIEDNHGVKVSKSSITMLKDKYSSTEIDFKAGKEPIIRTAKERLVLEAFKALYNIIGCFTHNESRIQGQSCERVVS